MPLPKSCLNLPLHKPMKRRYRLRWSLTRGMGDDESLFGSGTPAWGKESSASAGSFRHALGVSLGMVPLRFNLQGKSYWLETAELAVVDFGVTLVGGIGDPYGTHFEPPGQTKCSGAGQWIVSDMGLDGLGDIWSDGLPTEIGDSLVNLEATELAIGHPDAQVIGGIADRNQRDLELLGDLERRRAGQEAISQ